jgi:hypothetical protein
MNLIKFSDLMYLTLTNVEGNVGGDEIVFTTSSDGKYKLYHKQDCCESVLVEDICGDLQDLVGSPILMVEESSRMGDPRGEKRVESYEDIFTWTFYRLATAKGYVTIRWYGTSNGYYSESVDWAKIE